MHLGLALQLLVRSCIPFRCKKCEGFELLGTGQGGSLGQRYMMEIQTFSLAPPSLLGKQLLFSISGKIDGHRRGKVSFCCGLHYSSEKRMSSAQVSPALSSKGESIGLGEGSGGEMCVLALQKFSGRLFLCLQAG